MNCANEKNCKEYNVSCDGIIIYNETKDAYVANNYRPNCPIITNLNQELKQTRLIEKIDSKLEKLMNEN